MSSLTNFTTSASSQSLAATAAGGRDGSGNPSNSGGGGGLSGVGRAAGGSGNEAQGANGTDWSARANGTLQSQSSTSNASTNVPNTGRQSTGPRRPSLSTTLSHHPNHHSHSHNNFINSPLTPSASSTSLNSINNSSSTSSNVYHHPHHYNSHNAANHHNGGGGRTYTKEEMLNIYKNMSAAALEKGFQELLAKRSEIESGGGKDILSEVCWIENGKVMGPIAFEEMTSEEKELFLGNVNSLQKQQSQNQNNQNNQSQGNRGEHNSHYRDSQNINPPRKNAVNSNVSINPRESNNTGAPIRSQNARRATRDSSDATNHQPASPGFHNSPQQPPALGRRRTDFRGSIADAFSSSIDKEKDKDFDIKESSENAASRPHFGRWGSISNPKSGGDRTDDDHQDPPPSATVNRSMGLFRRGSSAWGSSNVASGGSISLGGVNLPSSGGANAFNNSVFGGSGGFALSGGVPTPSGNIEKRLGSKSKGDLKLEVEKALISSAANPTQKGAISGDESAKKHEDESERRSQGATDTIQESTEEDHFEAAMRKQQSRFDEWQKENSNPEDERPMSSDTDPYGRRDSLAEYVHNSLLESIKEQQQLPSLATSTIAAQAAGTDQTRLKAASPFSHTSAAGSSVTTPTRHLPDLAFNYGASNLGSLPSQLRDLHLGQQGGREHVLSNQGSVEGLGENEPLSPTETNPYQSPAPEKEDDPARVFREEDIGGFTGLPGFGGGVIGGGHRSVTNEGGSDRNGGSSTVGLATATGLGGGLGSLGIGIGVSSPGGGLWGTQGVGAALAPLGTPDRIGGVSASPGNFFGLGGETLGGHGAGFGNVSRQSRLGAIFMDQGLHSPQQPQQPQQLQQHQHQHQQSNGDEPLDVNNDAFDSTRNGGSLGVGSGRRLIQLAAGIGGAESPLRERSDTNESLFGLPTTKTVIGGGSIQEGESPLFASSHLGGIHGHQGFSLSNAAVPTLAAPIPQRSALPQPQAQALIMPDKIQWEYRDPQGVIQGPFSGLEMHDWFKGGYFPQDLHVKRIEDPEFEPLSQLIRRIGNQREPFLVPLQGLAPPGVAQGSVIGGAAGWGSANVPWSPDSSAAPGTIQPPFANSFPSFGTTLTAEQQNALERRKQEEQFLMARQREFLVQQQLAAKQAQAAVLQQQQLHPLPMHSQAGLSNLQPTPIGPLPLGGVGTSAFAVGPVGGSSANQSNTTFDQGVLLRQTADNFEGRVNQFISGHLQSSLPIANAEQGVGFVQQLQQQAQQNLAISPQQVQTAQQAFHLQQQAHLDRQHQQVESKQQEEQLQLGPEEEQASDGIPIEQAIVQDVAASGEQVGQLSPTEVPNEIQLEHWQPQQEPQLQLQPQQKQSPWGEIPKVKPEPIPTGSVLKNQDALQQQKTGSQTSSPQKATSPTVSQAKKVTGWNTVVEPSPLPAPFPPPPGRANSSLSINVDMVHSPSMETPQTSASVSIAPWAQKIEEINTPKASLKEIQESEAKQAAALAEQAAAEARKQALEQPPAPAPPPPQPGLPSTATWGNVSNVVGPSASAWSSKPLVKSASLPAPSASPKKTLQQIQKEEEAKKVKAAQSAAAVQSTAALSSIGTAPAGGKRYADLAGKPGTGSPAAPSSAGWTTVGQGGKKAPSAPAASTPSVPGFKPIANQPAGTFGKPTTHKSPPPSNSPIAASPLATKTPVQTAQEEFMKWCRIALRGLNGGVNQEDFLQSLSSFPSDPEIISDSIYANSSTMDGHRFAEEFIKRRTAANKGVSMDSKDSAFVQNQEKSSGGGWNEVAAKGNAAKKDVNSGSSFGGGIEGVGFKVVPGKKKGGRR